ncbi:Os12g0576750, partial [Oryza sativa Japonica Group]
YIVVSGWPLCRYTYRLGHRLLDGTHIWSKSYSFRASPYPGQDSVQRVVIFGDMGKVSSLCIVVFHFDPVFNSHFTCLGRNRWF